MKIYITILLAILFFQGCSLVKKTSAGAAIPFAAIGDTVVAPFQLLGDCANPLMNLGDDHYIKVYEESKFKTTIMLATATTYIYYLPGYFCMPFDYCTPDKYYSMTKSCLRTMNPEEEDEEEENKRTHESSYRKTPPRKEFKEW